MQCQKIEWMDRYGATKEELSKRIIRYILKRNVGYIITQKQFFIHTTSNERQVSYNYWIVITVKLGTEVKLSSVFSGFRFLTRNSASFRNSKQNLKEIFAKKIN